MSQSNAGRQTLELLGCYDSFMESIDSVCDMGCGNGEDLEWWATREVEDDDGNGIPLNIKCTGIDLQESLTVAKQYPNAVYERRNFEEISDEKKYDVIWCNDAFQYVINPLETLKRWRTALTDGGMLAMTVPVTTERTARQTVIVQHEYTLYHYTTVSMLHMLALCGFEIPFMRKDPGESHLHVIAYKSGHEPFNPRTTRMYDLLDKGLLPESAEDCIQRYGYLRQDQLVLEWLDRSMHWFGED
jgi:SAM-dependent methyltransferase